jgi:hypothetical protein
VYKSQVNRLTDIVRTSVDCSSFAAVNALVQVSSSLVLLCNPCSRVNASLARVSMLFIADAQTADAATGRLRAALGINNTRNFWQTS